MNQSSLSLAERLIQKTARHCIRREYRALLGHEQAHLIETLTNILSTGRGKEIFVKFKGYRLARALIVNARVLTLLYLKEAHGAEFLGRLNAKAARG